MKEYFVKSFEKCIIQSDIVALKSILLIANEIIILSVEKH